MTGISYMTVYESRFLIEMKRVLITGAAGFIGFHLAQHLHKRGDVVIGLDNFNAYYDPELKYRRMRVLQEASIHVICADIQEEALLKKILAEEQITHVVHLAAQAGVRHSLLKPQDYAASNLHGFLSILEACRAFPHVKLIYASSSSVYGLNKKTPFAVEDQTDHPTNLYGATKKANEVMAHAYHQLYGFSVTALRYFTVYGPWGRPDMAYYHFTRQISEGNPINVFNHGLMKRDFTYIDDIIAGTVAAIDLGASYEIFNLGNHNPVSLLDLIDLIEEKLGKKATRNLLPMQPGEVLETYADIQKSQDLLQFRPTTSIEEGISRFIDWYRSYPE